MIHPNQLVEYVIRPVLQQLDLHSEAAERLLLGTALAESKLHYLKQLGGGPALGIYQMEPATHNDIWNNYIQYRPELHEKVRKVSGDVSHAEALIGNLYYATAMTRIHYLRVPAALPDACDLGAIAEYWKTHYNTVQGKGTIAHFIEAAQDVLQA